MQVLTDNFAAEFGRGFGAVLLVETKSGTNQMHGEAYWYLQNSALNARSYFANAWAATSMRRANACRTWPKASVKATAQEVQSKASISAPSSATGPSVRRR